MRMTLETIFLYLSLHKRILLLLLPRYRLGSLLLFHNDKVSNPSKACHKCTRLNNSSSPRHTLAGQDPHLISRKSLDNKWVDPYRSHHTRRLRRHRLPGEANPNDEAHTGRSGDCRPDLAVNRDRKVQAQPHSSHTFLLLDPPFHFHM